VMYRHETEPVRRVVPRSIAAQLREFMREAVGEGGTGGNAQLANYSLLGKTGTAVRFEGGKYVDGEYTASFAALFPADHPQLVVVVKIDNPTGRYYGGLTAAPVTRTMLQQALASRRIGIDRSRLTSRHDATAPRTSRPTDSLPSTSRVVLSWPYQPPRRDRTSSPIPDITGRPVREGVHALHRLGFRVTLRGLGEVSRTMPPAGQTAVAGTPVTVWAE
jgi:cell division protein FtsI (penicillin-binding protein 3)